MTGNAETPNPVHPDLDRYSVEKLVDALVDDQLNAVDAALLAKSDGSVRCAIEDR